MNTQNHREDSSRLSGQDATARMDPAIKARWVAALRSGEYKQGHERLRDSDGRFCCLGVLCDLRAKEAGEKWATEDGVFFFHGASSYLPTDLLSWCGFSNAIGPLVCIDGRQTRLANHNDDGRTFAEIADAIEAQL